MKSKIGKLNLRVNNLELNAIEEKINEIIDHLNSQDQEEENNFVYTVGTPILESTTTCSQDTPEELIKRKLKEITTSERVGFLYAVGDDDLLANELYDYIQQLLDEREREVEKNLFKRLYSARSKKEFREMLDKLKGKK